MLLPEGHANTVNQQIRLVPDHVGSTTIGVNQVNDMSIDSVIETRLPTRGDELDTELHSARSGIVYRIRGTAALAGCVAKQAIGRPNQKCGSRNGLRY